MSPPPSSSPRLQNAAAIAGIVAIPATVVGAILAEARGKPGLLIPIVMVGAAAAMVFLKAGSGSKTVVATVVTAVALAGYGLAIWFWPGTVIPAADGERIVYVTVPGPTVVVTTPPPPPSAPAIDVIYPPPGQTVVDACFEMRFIGRPPDGYTFIVSNQRDGDPEVFYEGDVAVDADGRHWSAHTAIGVGDTTVTGKTYRLTVWTMPSDDAAYLLQTHAKPDTDETWWKSKSPPPGALHPKTVHVQRSAKATC